METEDLILAPIPKKLLCRPGQFTLLRNSCIVLPKNDGQKLFFTAQSLKRYLKESAGVEIPIIICDQAAKNTSIIFEAQPRMGKQEYVLDIGETGVCIGYGSAAGAFYAVCTLHQLILQYGNSLPCLAVEDCPDFPVRGVMLDISRDKIPTMSTLYALIDQMASFKLNHLEFYIEGFSFAYPSYPQTWEDQTPVTGEELVLLDRYCQERFIDLVPNQNSFGHMAPWLSRREFHELAECPDGCQAPWGWTEVPTSLNPLDAQSISFLEKTYDDLLPNFSSEYFNVGCDETFDLGQGKSEEQCRLLGKGQVYYNFLMSVYELVKKRGKKMMFWGDIILKSPEFISKLPRDMVALEWGYDADQPFAEDCEKFARSGIPYYVCPGTNTWNSIAGRTSVMKSNLINAAERGLRYGAAGYLNTDWGDGGHWQPLSASYPSYLFGAALSWCVEQNRELNIAACLDLFLFQDKNRKMGRFVLELGDYGSREPSTPTYNGTGMFRTLYYDQLENSNQFLSFLNLPALKQKDFSAVKDYVETLKDLLVHAKMECRDASLMESEFRTAMRLIIHAADLGMFKQQKERMGDGAKEEKLLDMIEDLNSILDGYQKNWLNRNRAGGLSKSVSPLENLKKQYEDAVKGLRSLRNKLQSN